MSMESHAKFMEPQKAGRWAYKMAEKGGLFPVTREALEKHEADLESKMTSIKARGTGRSDLIFLLKNLRIDREWTEAEDALRRGFCLYYEMYGMLQKRVAEEKIDGGIPESEKRAFLGAYSSFAASAFIEHRMNKNLKGDIMEYPGRKNLSFDFSQTENDVLNEFLALFYLLNEHRKNEGVVKTGQDLINSSIDFFRFMKEHTVSKKPLLNKKLVDLVSNANFRVMDEFTLSGFEQSIEEKVKTTGADYIPVLPHEIAGNVLAKTEMLRDADRLALYDPILNKNPITEVGGLSWSVIYVGLPGTGKTTLFICGRTRIDQRCEQVSEFWKTKNFPKLSCYFEVMDPKVKDPFYGKTGQNVIALCTELERADRINVLLIDDIDLLFSISGDRDLATGGADKDILNNLMQLLSGSNLTTRKRGGAQVWSATNSPASVDPALLQRFVAKYEVDGPQEWYDYADILSNKLGGWIKKGIILTPTGKDYTPFEMRKGQTGYEKAAQQIIQTTGKYKKGATLRDIGEFCKKMKDKNPRFTGRPLDSVADAVKKRINDYDIPEDWFTNPDLFFFKSYEDRVDLLEKKCHKVDGDVIMEEIERYARTEETYTNKKFEDDVGRYVHGVEVQFAGMERIKAGGKQ